MMSYDHPACFSKIGGEENIQYDAWPCKRYAKAASSREIKDGKVLEVQ
jgi:hypothetical protein